MPHFTRGNRINTGFVGDFALWQNVSRCQRTLKITQIHASIAQVKPWWWGAAEGEHLNSQSFKFPAGFDNMPIVRFSEKMVWIASFPASALESQASKLGRRLADKLPLGRTRSLRQQIQTAPGV